MLEIKDIENLVKLARIELTDAEKKKLLKEVDPILDYVTQLKEVIPGGKTDSKTQEHRNVMRSDSGETITGSNTEIITEEFPEKNGNYLKVKKIL